MITNKEEQENFIKYALIPMKNDEERNHKWYTSWVGYCEGEEVLECGFICPPTEHKVVEVFIYTKKEFQKQGFGTEAVKGLSKYCEAFDNIKYVCATIDKDNVPSQKMMIKSGYYYFGDTSFGKMIFNKQIKF